MAAQLGYCGLDAARRPLTGDEIRPCWEAADATDTALPPLPGVGPVWPLDPDDDRTSVRTLQFVEVTGGDLPPSVDEASPAQPAFVSPPTQPRWSLFGELEA